jgi:predicted ATP-grasp superfamily ATP-dependent carboligase
MRVLVTDDDSKAALGIVRSLGRRGIQVSVLADSPEALASRSRYCSTRHEIPKPPSDSFVPALINILRRTDYDLLVPVRYVYTAAMARHRAELGCLTRIEVADHERIKKAANKRLANQLAQDLGIPVPHTLYPENLEEAIARSSEFEYPVVIKASYETPGYTVRYVRTPAELAVAYQSLCHRNGNSCLPMVQEFIPGYGFGFFALYQDGICKRVFMHRRIRENPPTGGASTCAVSFYDPRLKEQGMRILDALRWHGVAMVEFRYDVRDHRYKLLEINPKFWGSVDLALSAGVDFPYCLCRMARGETLEYSENYDRKLRYHWPFSGEIQHLRRRPSSFGAVLGDLLNPRVKSNICLHDIRPNLNEAYLRVQSLIRRFEGGF